MGKSVRMVVTVFFLIIGAAILSVVVFFLLAQLKEYKPAFQEMAECAGNGYRNPGLLPEISLFSWNVGYCGLGAGMDFFYEGGQKVMPHRDQYQNYREGVKAFLAQNDMVDIVLLQEVDRYAARSFFDDQFVLLSGVLQHFSACFALNYNAWFIPVPPMRPLGAVKSGLSTHSGIPLISATRISAPGAYSWPKRLFMPKRCFLVTRYPAPERKELVVVNLHLSALAEGDALRKSEMKLLRNILLEEHGEKGNYVIAGGDWNQSPPGCKPGIHNENNFEASWPVADDFLPEGWTWAYDPDCPTNRDVSAPYSDTTRVTLIDYFVLSPNIQLITANTVDLSFRYSDHHPVCITIRFM